jgi:hypothetical protein
LKRDPFYQQIIDALGRQLDPDLFEKCAADLLRKDFPGLVPVRGGSDAGMDGAVADREDIPFPLISTTGKDVIGNLTKNLRSYIEQGGNRRKCILATSQALTPAKRRNLEGRAQNMEFLLLQIYDREAFADRLLYNPKWCLELLNLTGDLSPLSPVPLSTRPYASETLVGRQEDLKWLTDTPGDRVLTGQPGSGKTFLLRQLAKVSDALFVISRDTSKIALAYRALRPEIVIVDDAHLDPSFLTRLSHARTEIGASFDIIASCWVGTEDKILSVLNLTTQKCRPLDLLTRDQIVEIIGQLGIRDPVDLVRELVNQAEGRPGLAVTLAYLCINGDAHRVALGDVLCKTILNSFEPITGRRIGPILAAFAIGGSSGMPQNAAAGFLGLSIADLQETVTYLGWGGVISQDSYRKTLSVHPAVLRFALVRDIFFGGPARIDPTDLIYNAPDRQDVLLTLIGAKARGALISSDDLFAKLEAGGGDGAWSAYAWLGEDEAGRVLECYPEKILKIARPALHRAPEAAIPLLIKAATGDLRPLHSTTDHPLRIIQDWVESSRPGSGLVLERRECLLRSIEKALAIGLDETTCLRAISHVFSLNYTNVFSDPGSGDKFTIESGSVTLRELNQICDLWPKAFHIIAKLKAVDIPPIAELIHEVAFPTPMGGSLEKGFRETRKVLVSRIMNDLARMPTARLGLLHRLASTAHSLRIKLDVRVGRDFLTLFPVKEGPDWRRDQEHWRKMAETMANRFAKKNPAEVANRIAFLESEAGAAGITWPRLTPLVCGMIAERVTAHPVWIEKLIEVGASGDLVEPFLKKIVVNDGPGWETHVMKCAEIDNLRYIAVQIVLTKQSPPPELLDHILEKLAGLSSVVELLCFRGLAPDTTLARLLANTDPAISGKVAIAQWQADPVGQISPSLMPLWRNAILRLNHDDYWLGEILKKDTDLGYQWLNEHIVMEEIPYETQRIIGEIVRSLDEDKRKASLQLVADERYVPKMIDSLVGDSLMVYEALLNDARKRDYHLLPLRGFKEGALGEETWDIIKWIPKAGLALAKGYQAKDIADAVFGDGWSWEGKLSNMWRRWQHHFSELSKNEDPDIKEIARIGEKLAIERLKDAIEEERREDVYGR